MSSNKAKENPGQRKQIHLCITYSIIVIKSLEEHKPLSVAGKQAKQENAAITKFLKDQLID